MLSIHLMASISLTFPKYLWVVERKDITVKGRLSGRMKKFRIKVLVGDRVEVSVSPYDPSHGLITFRHK